MSLFQRQLRGAFDGKGLGQWDSEQLGQPEAAQGRDKREMCLEEVPAAVDGAASAHRGSGS